MYAVESSGLYWLVFVNTRYLVSPFGTCKRQEQSKVRRIERMNLEQIPIARGYCGPQYLV